MREVCGVNKAMKKVPNADRDGGNLVMMRLV